MLPTSLDYGPENVFSAHDDPVIDPCDLKPNFTACSAGNQGALIRSAILFCARLRVLSRHLIHVSLARPLGDNNVPDTGTGDHQRVHNLSAAEFTTSEELLIGPTLAVPGRPPYALTAKIPAAYPRPALFLEFGFSSVRDTADYAAGDLTGRRTFFWVRARLFS